MKVVEFHIESDKKNEGGLILVATTEDRKKYVVAGDTYYPTHVIPYESCWNAIEDDKAPKIPTYQV